MTGVSERRACRALGQRRSTRRKVPRGRHDEAQLTEDIVELARQYGRYGYRRVAALLRHAGWRVNDKRVERRAIVRHRSEEPAKVRHRFENRRPAASGGARG